MGQPVIPHKSHMIQALLTSPRFVHTQVRKPRYEVVSAPELAIKYCNTRNPATQTVLPAVGTPHDCVEQTDI